MKDIKSYTFKTVLLNHVNYPAEDSQWQEPTNLINFPEAIHIHISWPIVCAKSNVIIASAVNFEPWWRTDTPEMLAQRSRVISEHFDVQKKSDYLGEGELIQPFYSLPGNKLFDSVEQC